MKTLSFPSDSFLFNPIIMRIPSHPYILWLITFVACIGLSQAQTTTQNYVQSETILTPVTDPAQLNALGVSDRQQLIQYFDGLGRPLQQVEVEASPDKADRVTYFEYDNMGRQAKQHLPFTSKGNQGQWISDPVTQQNNFYQTTARIAQTAFPFAETRFENMPGEHILEQSAPGSTWQMGNGQTLSNAMKINTAADQVWMWEIDESTGLPQLAETYSQNNSELVAYTGFEGTDIGNWQYDVNCLHTSEVFSGTSSYYPNSCAFPSISGLDVSEKYYVSLQVKASGGSITINGQTFDLPTLNRWSKVEAVVTNSSSVTISYSGGPTPKLDELNLRRGRNMQNLTCVDFESAPVINPGALEWDFSDGLRMTNYNGVAPYEGSHFYVFLSSGSSTQISTTGLDVNEDYLVSFYARGNGSIDVNGTLVTLDGTWTWYQVPVSGASNLTIQASGTAYNAIDQLCLGVEDRVFTSYPAGELSATHSTDEHGKQEITFADRSGLKLLTRQIAGSEILETYYVYDIYGNLRAVISPLAVAELKAANSNDLAVLSGELIYTYQYDGLNRLIEKHLPGAGTTHIVYDRLDRPVLVQSENLRANDEWVFTKYDQYGRTIQTGIFDAGSAYNVWNFGGGPKPVLSREVVQQWADENSYTGTPSSAPLFEERDGSSFSTYHGYSQQAFPHGFLEFHTINYFDDHDFNRDGSADVSYQADVTAPEFDDAPDLRNQGAPTGNKVLVLGSSPAEWLESSLFYDSRGRNIQSQTNNYLGGQDRIEQAFDFVGRITHQRTTHEDGQNPAITVRQRYEYDHAGRLTRTYQKNNEDDEIVLVHQVYNELDQLVEKNLHSLAGAAKAQYLQSIDYAYNIRGWMTHLNNCGLTNDAFIHGFLDYNGNGGYSSGTLVQDFSLVLIERMDENENPVIDLQLTDRKLHVPAGQTYEPGGEYEQLYDNRPLITIAIGSETDPQDFADLQAVVGNSMSVVFDNGTFPASTPHTTVISDLNTQLTNELNNYGLTNSAAIGLVSVAVEDYLTNKLDQTWYNNDDNDLWGMTIQYDQPENGIGGTAQYNGNISGLCWQSKGNSQRKGYGFEYDGFNRLTDGNYKRQNTGGSWNLDVDHYTVSNIAYDANGNIASLQRQGHLAAGGFGTMDQLVYSYAGNQLQAVEDNSLTSGDNDFHNTVSLPNEYSYDPNGNLISDAHKGITVDYNHLNLPEKVDFGGGKEILYTYTATGAKLKKTVKEPGKSDVHRWYVGAFVYNDNGLEFFGTAEGRVVPDVSLGEEFRYEYHYKDYQFNIRLSFSDLDGNGEVSSTSEILQEWNYYPFGLLHTYDTPPSQIGIEHPFGYNGKELENSFGLAWNDFGFRFYDPQLSRWHVIDPMAESFYNWSGYNYVLGNPIAWVDNAGLAPGPGGRQQGKVKAGDNPIDFAARHNISTAQLVKWNPQVFPNGLDGSWKNGKWEELPTWNIDANQKLNISGPTLNSTELASQYEKIKNITDPLYDNNSSMTFEIVDRPESSEGSSNDPFGISDGTAYFGLISSMVSEASRTAGDNFKYAHNPKGNLTPPKGNIAAWKLLSKWSGIAGGAVGFTENTWGAIEAWNQGNKTRAYVQGGQALAYGTGTALLFTPAALAGAGILAGAAAVDLVEYMFDL